MAAYDPRRHQGTTPQHWRIRHPCSSSAHDRRRRRIPSSATPLQDLVSPCSKLTPVNLSYFIVMNFIRPHVFSGPSFISISPLCGSLILFMIILGFHVVGLKWALSPLGPSWAPYKRRDPPTNPSRHLRKEKSLLPLEWLLTKVEEGV